MTITDPALREMISLLSPSERRVEAHIAGEVTEQSKAVLRRLRMRLKRKARFRLPRRFVWLA